MIPSRYRWIAQLALAAWWIAMSLGSHWPRLNLEDVIGVGDIRVPLGLDKWLHVICYAGLSFGWLLLAGTGPRRIKQILFGLLIWAALDEWTQQFVPGRMSYPPDLAASMIGVGLGAMLFAVVGSLNDHDNSFIAHGRIVSALTLLSRLFGLVRDWALWRALGFGGAYDAFATAFMVPNLFRRLFGEGALAAAFIPHYSKLMQADPPAGRRLARRVLQRMIGLLLLLAVAGSLLALLLADLPQLGGQRGQLAARLSALTMGYMPLICCAAILGAILQVHKRFGVAAASPVLLNVCIIGAAVAALRFAPDGSADRAWWIVSAVLVAGVLQVIWHLWAGWSVPQVRGPLARPDAPAVGAAWSGLIRQWLPTVLGLAVLQINTLGDVVIAMIFSAEPGQTLNFGSWQPQAPMHVGSVAVLGSAARLYEFPLGVFGIAVATAIFPALSAAAGEKDRFMGILRQGLRLSLFIGIPASIGLLLVRQPLSAAIYHRAGSIDDALRVAAVLAGYAPAIWAYALNHTLTRAFYAHHDPVTPMRVAVGMVALNLAGNLSLIWWFGAAGLAISTAACAIVQCIILSWKLRKHTGPVVNAAVWKSWLRSLALSLVLAAVIGPIMARVSLDAMTRSQLIGLLGGLTLLGCVIFFGGAALLRMPEVGWIGRGRSRRDARTPHPRCSGLVVAADKRAQASEAGNFAALPMQLNPDRSVQLQERPNAADGLRVG